MKLLHLIALSLLTTMLFSQPGNLDLTFGTGGSSITNFGQLNAESNSVCLQSDGKIILSGIGKGVSDEDIIAVRYLPDGQIDPDFGDEGKIRLNMSNLRDRCYASAVDKSDNIYFTGLTWKSPDFKSFIVKFDANGHLVSSFAQNGIWISNIPETDEESRSILIQEDGKILIAGRSKIFGSPNTVTIFRLNSNGTLDNTYGNNGVAEIIVPENYNPRFARLNKDEEIIAGGFILGNRISTILVKFNHAGSIDSTFGTNGIMVENPSRDEFAYSMSLQKDNKIVVAAGVTISTGTDFRLTRYKEDGSLDSSFGINGKVTTDFNAMNNTGHSIAIQEDDKIILSGFVGSNPNHDYAIARYNTNGNLDISFGDDGKVTTDLGYDDLIFTSIIQSDGKLLCAGNSRTNEGFSSFSIARYQTQLETSTNININELTDFQIFPNPSNGLIHINADNAIVTDILIMDMQGRVLSKQTKDNIRSIDLTHLKSGIYLIKVYGRDWSDVKKLIISSVD